MYKSAEFPRFLVSNTLTDQTITVSDDASCLAGYEVNGPFSAYCEAQVIEVHALESRDGRTYAPRSTVKTRCARSP